MLETRHREGPDTSVESTETGGSSAAPKPTMRAEVILLATRDWCSTVEATTPAEMTVRRFETLDQFCEGVSGNVAVTLVSAAQSDDDIETAIRRTVHSSEHARTGLLATDGSQLLQCDVPRDEGFVFPEERERFERLIKHLYIRAYYSVAIARYYRIGVSIRNQKLRDDADEDIETLEQSRDRIYAYFKQFRRFLDPEDFEAMSSRDERMQALFESTEASTDPSLAGLPERCPDCTLDWTTGHGSRLRSGYERIGASTWRCCRCGHVIADTDPDNYRVS